MTYGLFLGCIAPNRYPGIEVSTREVMKQLDMETGELPGASCCPAPGVTKSFDRDTWQAVGARNLAIAEKEGSELFTICNGCFASLFEVAYDINQDEKERAKVNEALKKGGMSYNGGTKVRHFVEVLSRDVGLDAIRAKANDRLKGLPVAVHYGCHLLKPSRIKALDVAERPTIMDEIVEAAGAKSVPYAEKNTCCGAGGGVRARMPELATQMTELKLKSVKESGAKAIVTPCPFCHLQFDRAQTELKGYDIPVIHLSQLLAMAFGVKDELLGLDMNDTKVDVAKLHSG
jgi:heterodisulfide reductase subunit B